MGQVLIEISLQIAKDKKSSATLRPKFLWQLLLSAKR